MSMVSEKIQYYREIRDNWKKWNKVHYSGKKHHKRKQPWYMITKGKQFNYESRTQSWGEFVNYFRVMSQAGIFNKKYMNVKMTKERYETLLIQAKLIDWEKKHPRPVQRPTKENPQLDLFETEFMVPWVIEHTDAREQIEKFVKNIGNRALVYARYEGDIGYPSQIMKLRSDGHNFMSNNGNYANSVSINIRKVQRAANSLYENNPKLIALKIVDSGKECIIVPKTAA